MVKISSNKFKNHIDEYIELGKKETIVVTLNGEEIFTIVPKTKEISQKWEELFGILPSEAAKDMDIDRE